MLEAGLTSTVDYWPFLLSCLGLRVLNVPTCPGGLGFGRNKPYTPKVITPFPGPTLDGRNLAPPYVALYTLYLGSYNILGLLTGARFSPSIVGVRC